MGPLRQSAALAALIECLAAAAGTPRVTAAQTWTADNGNGTYSNPLFFDEFADPDIIRVGDVFYATATTMHAMPGLPVLRSRDLVNWEFVSYACDKLDLGPAYHLVGGNIYGQGIWAPSLRYHNGTFHIFSNVNHENTQHFTATDPHGPWKRTPMKRSLHDLSVLFDDDGKAYVVWGYQELHFAQLDSALDDIIPSTERVLFAKDAGMGEGAHFYKINGKYFIFSAWYAGRMRLPAARADHPEGPYEVNLAMSADEAFGLRQGNRLRGNGTSDNAIVVLPPTTAPGHNTVHQGGVVSTPAGEWWGFAAMDGNSLGRLTILSPVTWKDGWPYFGLPGNLGRTPRTWVKPKTAASSAPHAPFVRSDDFSRPTLTPIWQWNHIPDDSMWSLRERPGYLRLHSLPATSFWTARNTLTQRGIGPQSTATTILDATGLREHDVAGLALLNKPYAWVGVRRTATGLSLQRYDQLVDSTITRPLAGARVWLRAETDYLAETARFSYSTDGRRWTPIGPTFPLVFQLKTFQGVRVSLFHYNDGGAPGGYADFDRIDIDEPYARGVRRPIPIGRTIAIEAAHRPTSFAIGGAQEFTVEDRGLGRVALRAGDRYVSVTPQTDSTSSVSLRVGHPGDAETFQWMESFYGDLLLMSVETHRYLRLEPNGSVSSDSRGAEPDPNDGTALRWRLHP